MYTHYVCVCGARLIHQNIDNSITNDKLLPHDSVKLKMYAYMYISFTSQNSTSDTLILGTPMWSNNSTCDSMNIRPTSHNSF